VGKPWEGVGRRGKAVGGRGKEWESRGRAWEGVGGERHLPKVIKDFVVCEKVLP